jgi:hypothetical protein
MDDSRLKGRRGVRFRAMLATFGALALTAATASEAGATLRVQNHNDPAGDPTMTTYTITGPAFDAPIVFALTDEA